MQIDDLVSNGFVRRWTLVDGQARCVEDALAGADPGAMAALQRNAAVRALIGTVEQFEAAQAVVARGEPDNGAPRQIPDPAAVRPEDAPDDWTAPLIANPEWALLPRTVETTGVEGQTQTAPEPRWLEYDAAGATIAAASPTTLALARWRQGEPSEAETEAHATWEQAKASAQAALDIEAAKPLTVDPRPIEDEISRRQFAQACAVLGYMTQAEAMAFVTTNTAPAAMDAAISSLPLSADKKFSVRIAVAGSAKFQRLNPATSLVMMAMGRSNTDRDAIWRLGATFP